MNSDATVGEGFATGQMRPYYGDVLTEERLAILVKHMA